MNKISKKIVALVTMAAFVLTLVPAAAFAADATVNGSNYTVTSEAANQLTVTVNLDNTPASDAQIGYTFTGIEKAKMYVVSGGTDQKDARPEYEVVKPTGKTVVVKFSNVAPGATKVNVTMTAGGSSSWGVVSVAKDGTDTANVIYPATTDKSTYGVVNESGQVQSEASVAVGSDLTTEFRVNDIAGDATTDTLSPVWIWATQGDKIVEIGKVTADKTVIPADEKGYKLDSVKNGDKVTLQFAAAGTYTIHAGEGEKFSDAQTNAGMLLGATVVTVTDDTVVNSMDVTATYGKTTVPMTFDEDTNTYTLNLAKDASSFNYNGIDEITLNGVAKEEDGTAAKYQTINFATTKSTVVELDKTSDNTDNNGKFDVSFNMSDKSNAVITMTDAATGLEYSVRVIAAETTAQNIDRTKTGGYVLAGNDSKYGEATYGAAANKAVKFSDAVQFTVTDDKGETVTGNEAVAGYKIDVRSRANGSTLEADDLALVWDAANGVYTLGYTGADKTGDYAKDLIPGKYEVRVALASGDNATVTFNVAKFGKVEDMTVDMFAANTGDGTVKPTDVGYTITDEVTLGQTVIVTAKYVDGNGIKVSVDPSTLQYGFDGKAVREVNASNNVFSTAYDTPANESLLGTLIHVKVYNKANKQLVEKDLTVVDSYNSYSLEFDPAKGPINEDNDVTVKVVDKDGNVSKVNGTVSAFVADKSDADAKVSVDTTGASVSNGKATISVYGDRETTADIVVVVKAGSAIYAGTLEYTFGTEDPLANRTVVMTIGSSDYVVNNKIVTGDAAPFVDSNWRTMVPLRALAESFDAEVNWDNDARTVTINYDANTQIVMTIGESTYTVNGEEKTMDTAPVIQGDRTYVPIRFAAQGMGFSVTPLYDSNNLTASVVFQK